MNAPTPQHRTKSNLKPNPSKGIKPTTQIDSSPFGVMPILALASRTSLVIHPVLIFPLLSYQSSSTNYRGKCHYLWVKSKRSRNQSQRLNDSRNGSQNDQIRLAYGIITKAESQMPMLKMYE
ncbi:hypothetical protein EYC84_004932 [Monilinia fructicola]|uniref:Uncharacterized protein n=1 Tax=Monilinia fructicola TaxID=38448 RepID=A0A5M9K5F3_MONFR|nr:hypothetical protein EYC84_004932 [Monilinia fructicola]